MHKILMFLFVAAFVAAAPAQAQDKRMDVNIGGGYTASMSDVGKYLGDGYNVNIGFTIHATPIIGIQAEYSYNGLGKKQVLVPVVVNPLIADAVDSPFFADMNMQFGDFNLIVKPPVEGNVKPYLVAGVGVYYRPIKVTTPSVGYVPGYCNPWYYVCVPGGYVPVEEIVGSRSSTDFGMDVGGGVNFKVGEAAAIYFEIRYHYIWGPKVTDPTTNTDVQANGQFLPVTFGIRF